MLGYDTKERSTDGVEYEEWANDKVNRGKEILLPPNEENEEDEEEVPLIWTMKKLKGKRKKKNKNTKVVEGDRGENL